MTEYNAKTKKHVTKEVQEFLAGKIYCGRVAISNSSEIAYPLKVTTEIPEGSLPLNVLDYSTVHSVDLKALSVSVLQYYFYFPQTGTFKTFLSSATSEGQLIGVAAGSDTLEVKKCLNVVSKETMQDLLNTGTTSELLTFLQNNNIHDLNVFNPGQVLWLFQENEEFFHKAFAIFRQRCYFDINIWSFTLKYPRKEYLIEIERYN